MNKIKHFTLIFSAVAVLASTFLITPISYAQESVLPGFTPNRLIEDAVFSDKTALGNSEGVQKFLESKQVFLLILLQIFWQDLKSQLTQL